MSALKMRKRQREFTYGIFLSFNGKDTRKSFTDHLHRALIQQGIETFRDDKSLERGEDFAPELLRAIRESWGSIIVISQGYAFSRWCLEELVEIIKQREERGHRVYPVFYHVEPSDFRHQRNSVKEAFDKHKKRYNEEITLGWRVALEKVTDINGWPLKDQYESVFIEDIVKDVSTKIDPKMLLDEEEVEEMKSTFRTIQAWLVDAENKQYMKEGEAVKVLLDKLKHIAYDMDDVLDEWNTVILRSNVEKDQSQIPSTSSSSLSEVRNIPLRIRKLNKNYKAIVKEEDHFKIVRREGDIGQNNSYPDPGLERSKSTCFVEVSEIYGRDQDKQILINMLLSENNLEGKGIPIISIVGMGGIGKTTLAQIVYNHHELTAFFQKKIWVCVSDPFDEMRVAKAILEGLWGRPSTHNELNSVLECIHSYIKRRRYLLVLDDVWNEDEGRWQSLKNCLNHGSQGSKILVTTRKESVATVMACTELFHLGKLSQEECWSLFSQTAFSGRNDREREVLEDIGKKIAHKCQGLPLAAKFLGALLRLKRSREQWQRILDSHMWELDEAVKGIFAPLLLSYFDMPSVLRQCFSYCAIFPKDHLIGKDMLIKLWMAQGFLGEIQGNEMEIVGEEYFDILTTHSFFQDIKKDAKDDTIIIGCKMHDIVHDFAQLLRKTESCMVASNGIEEQQADFYHENVRHLTLIPNHEHVGIPDATYNVKKLRSLLVDSRFCWTSGLEASLPKLFDQLTCLRMLNLSKSSIKELPQKIGKLIHLRYLSLEENTKLVELPEAFCDLFNLQTLNIRGCINLRKLPCGMKKLINLRHLQNAKAYRIKFMPKGMHGLTYLRTLEEFSVVDKGEGIESETSCSLADLGKLIHLRGHIVLKGMGRVGEASEATEARLSEKAGLLGLSLRFGGHKKEPQTDEECVLQALQPPQQLQILGIEYYKGYAFPNWMMSLTSLKRVQLHGCHNWESLPPMGKLPSLESLSISWMKKVKWVGEEFVGVETSSSSSSVNHNISAFPNLKTLEFGTMFGWEEWEYEKGLRSRGGQDSSSSSSSYSSSSPSNITIMPKLQCLSIMLCPELKTLPCHLLQSRALQQLKILHCPVLHRRFNKKTGKGWPSISHIPDIEIRTKGMNE